MNAMTLACLRRCSRAELEDLYVASRPISVPRGLFHGCFLAWLDTPGARHPVFHPLQVLGFELTPFGVDFTARRWFFFHPRLAAGRFTAEAGPSRWRDTDAVCLRYEVSRLPGPLRRVLYDEVKPLSPTLCLGLGGINAARGRGDHFFFALTA